MELIRCSLPLLAASAPASFYLGTNFYVSTKPLDVADPDFPSLAGGSLNDSLLNSPLEVDSTTSTPSDTLTSYSYGVLEEFMDHDPEVYGIITTRYGATTAAMPGEVMYAASVPSIETSHFDEATWKDGYDDLLTSNIMCDFTK